VINYKYSNILQFITSVETLISLGYKLIKESDNTNYIIAMPNDSFNFLISFSYNAICENVYGRMTLMKT
jgi:hypothetical protein